MNDTAQQTAIYENVAHGAGHTLVIARAGTGKTTTIERSLAYIDPSKRCLFVAFNKSVADELKRRVKRPNVTIGTCHSFGLSAIRGSLGEVTIDRDRCFKMAGQVTNLRAEKYMLVKAVGLAKGLLLDDGDDILDACDSFGVEVGQYPERFANSVLELLRRGAVLDGSVDYDDMVWLPVTNDTIEVPQYDFVMVDEVQDLNAGQLKLVRAACAPGGRIIAIGDDMQAIYGFRGISDDVVGALRTELRPTELALTTTFRCAKAIVTEAQRIVPDIVARSDAPLGAVERNVSLARMLDEVEYGDFILSRTNSPLIRTALQLLRTDCRVSVAGREVGNGLTSLVYKLRASTPQQLITNAKTWLAKEERRLAAKDRPSEESAALARDKVECIEALASSSRTVDELLARVKMLFDETRPQDCVTLSSTHRAKGLERDKVWVLADTYLRARHGVVPDEERRLYYVAVTRAKSTLMLVRGLPGAK